jgi:hypothetical protein
MAPPYCSQCKEIFNSQEALDTHLNNPVGENSQQCEYRDVPEPAGMTRNMEGELKPRWTDGSPKERWNRAYRILFPGEVVPDPCESTCTQIQMVFFGYRE